MRPGALHRPESRHQSPAHADDAARSLKTRSADYRAQPAARAWAGAVYVAAAPCRDADAQLDADRIDLLSGEGWRRYRSAEGNHEDPGGTRCEKSRRRR